MKTLDATSALFEDAAAEQQPCQLRHVYAGGRSIGWATLAASAGWKQRLSSCRRDQMHVMTEAAVPSCTVTKQMGPDTPDTPPDDMLVIASLDCGVSYVTTHP